MPPEPPGWPAAGYKVLRDPVHNLIAFEGRDRELLRVIDCREFQRLRWIRQLGVCFLAYPGTEHSRFCHSVGVLHVMQRLLATLAAQDAELPRAIRLDETLCTAAKLYALLHDVGHGPFSHLFERVFDLRPDADKRLHERWSLRLVEDDESELGATVRAAYGRDVYDELCALMTRRHLATYLSRLVSSQLDADRFDYLMRDNLASGTTYGFYDLEWILRSLRFVAIDRGAGLGEWVVAIDGRKGLYSVEQYLLARRNMYQQVYLHKTTRVAESMVLAVLERLRTLIAGDRAAAERLGAPPGLVRLALGEEPTVGEYVDLDDATLWHCFKQWARGADDRVLADLCGRLVARRLFKAIDLGDEVAAAAAPGGALDEELRRAVAPLVGAPVEAASSYVRVDAAEASPYDERDEPICLIYSERGRTKVIELHRHPQLGATLAQRSSIARRLIVAGEARDAAAAVIAAWERQAGLGESAGPRQPGPLPPARRVELVAAGDGATAQRARAQATLLGLRGALDRGELDATASRRALLAADLAALDEP